NMTVNEACDFFESIPSVFRKIDALKQVGLGYIQLGQSAVTLSGGEAQRVKLATELSKISTGNTIYILDEPTTGLHFEDISILLSVLNKIVDKGNTVLVIEHNLDVIKVADWVVDMGPEGGAKGGEIVAEGNPEEVAKKLGPTAPFLRNELQLTASK
ncbi:MAG: excinuclease ABC subunit UvrA, partial [Bacteroidota bacterium]|nr:excinuclease ABC subunit UvrA [Bacteroidota bacterium]